MTTEAQRQASRVNGAKSRGPTSPGGKDASKFNGLKHGLRAEQVVLPGEDPAEFEAELAGWAEQFAPAGHAEAVLVERAAVAAWRLRRCVRAEAELVRDLALRAREEALADARDRDTDRDDDDEERIGEAAADLEADPVRVLAELRSTPRGVDRLVEMWDRLDGRLEAGSHNWGARDGHGRLMALLGHGPAADPSAAREIGEGSRRLADSNGSMLWADRMPEDEADEVAAGLRRGIARERQALRDLRRALEAAAEAEAAAEPAGGDEADEPAEAAGFPGVTPEVLRLHRYEMAHERSLRAAMKDLLALEKARPSRGPAAGEKTQSVYTKRVTTEDREASPRTEPSAGGAEAGASPAPSEPGRPAVPAPSAGPRRGRGGRPRTPSRPDPGLSAS